MAKDKKTKERERAKERRAARQRSISKQSAERRSLQHVASDMLSAKARAIVASLLPERLCSGASSRFVPEPAHYAAMLRVLDAMGDRQAIEAVAWRLSVRSDIQPGLPPGMVFIYRADGSPAALDSLPALLWIAVDDVPSLLINKMAGVGGEYCFWLTWDQVGDTAPVPAVIAVNSKRDFAMWFLDLNGNWFPATSEIAIRKRIDATRAGLVINEALQGWEPALWRLLSPSEAPYVLPAGSNCIRHDDERLQFALQATSLVQSALLFGLVGSCQQFDAAAVKVNGLLDEIRSLDVDRNDALRRIATLEGNLADAARHLSTAKRQVQPAPSCASPAARPVLSVAERLSQVFSDR